MLAEMTRQILRLNAQLEKFSNLRMIQIEASIAKMIFHRVGGIFVFPRTDQARKPPECFWIERKCFADFARRRFPAIRNDIRGHRRAVTPIALIHVLNCALALIAAREIEIDVGPFAALLRQKTLEEQSHPDRINRGDSQRVAHRAVSSRTAPLYENVLRIAKTND